MEDFFLTDYKFRIIWTDHIVEQFVKLFVHKSIIYCNFIQTLQAEEQPPYLCGCCL